MNRLRPQLPPFMFAVVAVVAMGVCGCDLEGTVCDLPESRNTCQGDGDCLVIYCLLECCPCDRVASQRQYDETYCVVDVNDVSDYRVDRNRCAEAADTACDGVDCADNPCPYIPYAVCVDGSCHSPEW